MVVLVVAVVLIVFVSLFVAFFWSCFGAQCAGFGLAALEALLSALGARYDVDNLTSAVLAAVVAGPVFKEIAEKVYSSSVDFIEPINNKQDLLTKAPGSIKSQNDEMVIASKALKLPTKSSGTDDNYVSRNNGDSTSVSLQPTNIKSQLDKGIVPNLNGLSAKDALFLLENSGFHVKLFGMGSVKKQSIEAGQKFNKGDKITLILS